MKLRLILGDQLNQQHSWFQEVDRDVRYFMAEMRQETDYVKHHIQKVVAFFISMRNFKKWLEDNGHQVIYYTLDDLDNTQNLTENLKKVAEEQKATSFEYQLPDEYRLDQQLKEISSLLQLPVQSFDTEHFLTSRTDLTGFFEGKKQMTMEYFYRDMRKKYGVMMVNEKEPEGGKWNFDKSNRNKWTGKDPIPPEKEYDRNVAEIVSLLEKHEVQTIGNINEKDFDWPTSREECLEVLQYFCKYLLIHFGDYQDAMHEDEKYLFHSRLSFAMNSKMLSPKEVIDTIIDYWRSHQEDIRISQVEGFVRQILGWREYMRGVYWKEMPSYKKKNKLQNKNKLPEFYWTGKTKMNCLHHAIHQSLDDAYAHHIQRLMITGNYALLTQCDPDEVDEWYLGIYIDAIEWVELTNTRGMSQFADGGIVATKPYVSTGSYINKMSNYCKGCHYKVSKKLGDDACPFNVLYWNFLDDKRAYFKGNQRMSMMMSLLNKMSPDQLTAYKERANHIIENPHEY
ncbi:cryptochrome/photolyase family protein [Aquimarina sp. ERC-38]|uniref:cryptochrome/photolyase family protein n=1 Tax=Aquimarina sp. ERC-38 TaxID=2949996 RepID=UPI002245AAAD|nr:cryptochrome/photolyase family protein [Aquimarina sp. ERC-38]UZO82417.1 cryptochrome/photolyase family protein [Aquimarina sp. ERC-38]